jgi:hypothetical protein
MQLPQPDLIYPQLAAALVRAGDQMFGAAIDAPLMGPATGEAGLGGNQQPVIGMQRLGDQLLGNIGAIRVCGVDEVHTQFGQPLQHPDRLGRVGWRTPYARAGDLHSAKTQSIDRNFAADLKRLGHANSFQELRPRGSLITWRADQVRGV